MYIWKGRQDSPGKRGINGRGEEGKRGKRHMKGSILNLNHILIWKYPIQYSTMCNEYTQWIINSSLTERAQRSSRLDHWTVFRVLCMAEGQKLTRFTENPEQTEQLVNTLPCPAVSQKSHAEQLLPALGATDPSCSKLPIYVSPTAQSQFSTA